MGQEPTKIGEDLCNSKNLVFNVKQLLNNGVDLMPWLRGRKKLFKWDEGKSSRFRPVNKSTPTSTKSF
jgi:hypothetical protein